MQLQETFHSIKQEMEKELEVELSNVSCTVSKEGLSLWEAACCWIHEDGSALIQLSPRLEKGRFFGYSSGEIIRHELVHAVRSFEKGDRFEELLACTIGAPVRKGFSRYRRVLPALFQTHKEVWLFIVIFFLSWGVGVCFAESFFEFALVFAPVLIMLVFCSARLFRNLHILKSVMRTTPISSLIQMKEQEILQAYKRLL